MSEWYQIRSTGYLKVTRSALEVEDDEFVSGKERKKKLKVECRKCVQLHIF